MRAFRLAYAALFTATLAMWTFDPTRAATILLMILAAGAIALAVVERVMERGSTHY
jgi:hypothetical protein